MTLDQKDDLFDEANVTRKLGNDHPSLTEKEVETSAGQKLIMLLRCAQV